MVIGDFNVHSSNLTGSVKDSRSAFILEEMIGELDLVVANGLGGKDLGILKASSNAKTND